MDRTTEPRELPLWDELNTEELPAVELYDEEEHRLTFLSDKPFETTSQKFKGKRVMLFTVEEAGVRKTLIVTSLRLALHLKRHAPLTEKTLTIQRIGKSTSTDYEVSEVQNASGEELEG